MKKILTIMCIAALTLFVSGCGSIESQNTGTTQSDTIVNSGRMAPVKAK